MRSSAALKSDRTSLGVRIFSRPVMLVLVDELGAVASLIPGNSARCTRYIMDSLPRYKPHSSVERRTTQELLQIINCSMRPLFPVEYQAKKRSALYPNPGVKELTNISLFVECNTHIPVYYVPK
ncbi:hypothetical protein [Nostoc sp.]|uniref:hypothetical protein n=1 Tax=Nostoc sp. TaxID=1180 RepID=UPI002FFBB682